MDIIDHIQKAAAQYTIKTGVTPSRVYLGTFELMALNAINREQGVQTDPHYFGSVHMIDGLRVHAVQDLSHLAVA